MKESRLEQETQELISRKVLAASITPLSGLPTEEQMKKTLLLHYNTRRVSAVRNKDQIGTDFWTGMILSDATTVNGVVVVTPFVPQKQLFWANVEIEDVKPKKISRKTFRAD